MQRSKGFTLIELMVVIGVIAILAAIALPNYSEYSRKGRRAEASRFAGEIQLSLERWRSENPSYANCSGTGCGSGSYPTVPDATASPYYTIAIATATATDYSITATPIDGSPQADDRCGILTATRSSKPRWATAACN